jgi:serine/threonine protein kinase
VTELTHIGPYAVERRLGGGGMAEVFLANLVGVEGFSAPVAIKRVLPHFADQPAFAAMFVSEAKLSARLRHPNIVSVLDFNRDEEHGLFLVMELVDGKDLAQLLATGSLPISLAIYITTEVLRGLGHAHDPPRKDDGLRGIVHRDISPQNVLLSWEGEVKISDFGIAKSRETTQAAASLMIKGKPAYMSPEQADGRPLDGRSDLFAVGVMLWEMLTGHPLFCGSSTQEILASLLWSPISAPTVLRPELPADVCAVVMRLLERDVARRYATAEAARMDLLACGDAPRDGRTELTRLAQTRFLSPSQAPTLVASQPPRVRIGAPARPAATLKLGGWPVPRLWLLFLLVLLAATGATVGLAALVTNDVPARGAVYAPTPLAPPVEPKEPAEIVPAGPNPVRVAAPQPAVVAPTAAPPAAASKRVRKKPSAPPAEAPSGIVEIRF